MAIKADATPQPQRSPALEVSWRSGGQMRAATIGLVGATVLATWVLSGVSFGDAARFIAFESVFVLLPGAMVFALVSRSPQGWLRTIAIGWPLGCALEIGAFALTAALGERSLFALLPVVALATIGPALAYRRMRTPSQRPRPNLGELRGFVGRRDRSLPLLIAGMALSLALIVLAIRFFTPYPLPGHARSVAYLPDNVYDISLSAEALHHWPITQSYVAGQPLRFYTGLFIHVAAVSQVTGVAPATVILRLLPSTIVLVIALQLWLLCRDFCDSRWVAPTAIVLFLLFSELGLDATRFGSFGVSFFNVLTEAPTNALAVPLLLAMLAIVQRELPARGAIRHPRPGPPAGSTRRGPLGPLLAFAVLALGAGAVKTEAVADLLGGIVLFWLMGRFLARRALPRLPLAYGAVSLISIGIIYRAMLSGGVSSLRIQPFSFVPYTVFAPLFPAHSILRFVLLACAGTLACALLIVPLLGALWLLRERDGTPPFAVFCTAVFVVSTGAYLILAAPRDSGLDFMLYGYVAMVPVAALGLTRLWANAPAAARRAIIQACLAILVLGLVIAGSSELLTAAKVLARAALIPGTEALLGHKRLAWGVWYVLAYALVVAAIVLASLKLEPRFAPVLRSRASRWLACCIPMVVTLGLVEPLGIAGPEVWKTIAHRRRIVADSRQDQGMSAALYSGLTWVRRHTASCDVLAVNNHYLLAPGSDSRYFYYSAFAERMVFLESWAYPAHWPGEPQPFPARLALNELAVSRGDPVALRQLQRDGVSYVLIDKTHGRGAPEPPGVSRLVFANQALDVYELVASARVSSNRAACQSAVND